MSFSHPTYLAALLLWLLAFSLLATSNPYKQSKGGTISVPTLGKGETFVVFLFTVPPPFGYIGFLAGGAGCPY